jgi:hypothetical protein
MTVTVDSDFLDLPYAEARRELGLFNSYRRTEALLWVMWKAKNARDVLDVFLKMGKRVRRAVCTPI